MTIVPLVILVWASLLFTNPVQSNYSHASSIGDRFPPANSTLEERESFLRSLLPPNADKGGSDGCTSRVDSTANTLNELVLIGILIPVWGEVASTNLAHFMDGKGGVKYIDYEWLRSFNEVKAIEDSLQKDVNGQAQSIAPTLADGETKVINLKPTSPMIYFPGGFYTTELYWASGSSTMKVTGTLELYRDGDTVQASADLFLDWRDDYDWHLGASVWIPGFGRMYDHDIKMLEFCKGAKPFVLLSSWKLTWTTTIKVDDDSGQIDQLSNSCGSGQMVGDNVVPPVETESRGSFNTGSGGSGSISGLYIDPDHLPITGIHLHAGKKGENGPIIAHLGTPVGSERSAFTIGESDLVGPMKGKTLSDFQKVIAICYMYVQVHTAAYPNGEIRFP